MKKLHVTNLTGNSNLAIYMGAYMDIIFRLAILDLSSGSFFLGIVPYLNQMNIHYKVYADVFSWVNDMDSFRPDAVFIAQGKFNLETVLDSVLEKCPTDVLYASLEEAYIFKNLPQKWYSAIIYNPELGRTTYVYHTNAQKNMPYLQRLNYYRTIKVE